MEQPNLVYADIAKNVFQVLTTTSQGAKIEESRLNRQKFEHLAGNLPPGSTLYIEACGSMHYWGRVFQRKGHKVLALPPQHVRPYRQGQKNDPNDTRAIQEASKRPNQRFVPIKTEAQQDIQLLLRIRERRVAQRTQLINQMRGFLLEYGIEVPQGASNMGHRLSAILEKNHEKTTARLRSVIAELRNELRSLEVAIKGCERELRIAARLSDIAKRVDAVPGVGFITAATIVAKGYRPGDFKNGRQFAAALGVVPRQFSSGGRIKLGRISKTGDKALRSLLVLGAQCVIRHSANKHDPTSLWVRKLVERKGVNLAAVALANKNARTIWCLINKREDYKAAVTVH